MSQTQQSRPVTGLHSTSAMQVSLNMTGSIVAAPNRTETSSDGVREKIEKIERGQSWI